MLRNSFMFQSVVHVKGNVSRSEKTICQIARIFGTKIGSVPNVAKEIGVTIM